MKIVTDDFVVVGTIPNDSEYPCLICGAVPDCVWQSVELVEKDDLPDSLKFSPKPMLLVYRLCLPCHELEPEQWKVRMLLFERNEEMAETLKKHIRSGGLRDE